jgi:hypothetical protein
MGRDAAPSFDLHRVTQNKPYIVLGNTYYSILSIDPIEIGGIYQYPGPPSARPCLDDLPKRVSADVGGRGYLITAKVAKLKVGESGTQAGSTREA